MSTIVRVRREASHDISGIRRAHNLAFGGDTAVLTWEARLVEDLRGGPSWIPALSIVAEVDGTIVGHVLATRGRLEHSGPADPVRALGLAPVGVLPDYQALGIGTKMIYALLGAAGALDEDLVCLLGDPRYYSRFGFVLASTLRIAPPHPAWEAHFQALPLGSPVSATQPATFFYDGAFDRAE